MNHIFHQQFKVDASHIIHFELPFDMGGEVDVIVLSRQLTKPTIPPEAMAMAQLLDESGFAKNVLSRPEEECWNDL